MTKSASGGECVTCNEWYGRDVPVQLNWHVSHIEGLHDFTQGLENQLKLLRAAKLVREVIEDLKK